MSWKLTTALLLIVTVLGLVVYDMFAEALGGDASTISQVIYWAARTVPAVAFGAGFLCGHLFWPQNQDPGP
jgi:hypothetical protein